MTEPAVFRDADGPDATTRERDALQALVESPGWAGLCGFVAKKWSAGRVIENLEADLAGIPATDITAQSARMREWLNAKKVADEITRWPEQRLKQLTDKPERVALVTPRRA